MRGRIKWKKYAPLIMFAAFIWGYSLVDVFWPSREYSEMENRYLKQAPAFSARALWSNEYTLSVEEYTNDQFFLRDAWITAKSMCETALLKIENNGVVYGRDGYMFERRVTADNDQLYKNMDSLLYFAEKFPGKSITLMLVPASDAVLTDKLPRGLDNAGQLSAIADIYARASAAGMKTADAYTALISAYNGGADAPYYRTDHHWTTDGALLSCGTYFKSLGLEKPVTGNYSETPDFYGTYYSKCKLFSAVPDVIRRYDVPVKSVVINGEPASGLYDTEKLDTRDKYAAFLYGNNGVTVIESDCNLNRVQGKPSRVLMFKDSFGNSFAPFLCYGFDEVTVVDLRYFMETEKLMLEGGYDEILVLYSFPSFAQETSIVNLKL